MNSLNLELFECHVCGKKSPYEDDLEECDICGKIVCVECSRIIDSKTMCLKCEDKEIYSQ